MVQNYIYPERNTQRMEDSHSQRLQTFFDEDSTQDPLEHISLLKLTYPEHAEDISEYEVLTRKQTKLIEQRHAINQELERLDEKIQESAADVRSLIEDIESGEVQTIGNGAAGD